MALNEKGNLAGATGLEPAASAVTGQRPQGRSLVFSTRDSTPRPGHSGPKRRDSTPESKRKSARKRQLLLPGVETSKRPVPTLRARRDWTEWQFRSALARNGFEYYGAVHFIDVSGGTDAIFEAIHLAGPPLRIARRATLAKILRERDALPLCSSAEVRA